jgi:uncharacterized protein with von Willebrand factor type A (vWA) domain
MTDQAVLERLVGFGRYLRASGLDVGTGRVLSFCRAAALLDPSDRTDLRLAARATLVSRPEEFELLDGAFDRYFGSTAVVHPVVSRSITAPPSAPQAAEAKSLSSPMVPDRRPSTEEGRGLEGRSAVRLVASDVEVLRAKDFGEMSEDERKDAAILIRRLALIAPTHRSRRYRAATLGQRFDLRRTMRQSLGTGGEPFRRAWKRRQTRKRPLVLVLDVSGSMAPYSRAPVEFGHAAAASGRRVEVFCFGTRLTRITRIVRTRDAGDALKAVGQAVNDWEGGTRIGDSLKELLDRWGSRSALRGSVVVLCSDGLERADPAVLTRQMRRLSRLAHRLLWVNPLKGSPRYEPLARGMAASLPFLDAFLPGHNLQSLGALADAVAVA